MIIAFQRVVGTASISMIIDDDWTTLKHAMCEQWHVGNAFDHYNIWERLREGQVVTFEKREVYQVWNCYTQGEYADELFQGRHVDIIMDEEPE